MTPEQEAQTMAEMRAEHQTDSDYMQDGGSVFEDLDAAQLYNRCTKLLLVIDSQSQRLAEQAAEIEMLKAEMLSWQRSQSIRDNGGQED